MNASREVVPINPWIAASVCATAAALVALALTLAPPLHERSGPGKFAVVDLAAVVRANQQHTVALLADKGADPAARTSALARTRDFGQQLDREVRALSAECDCVLLMREAVVAGELEDLTPALMARLGRK